MNSAVNDVKRPKIQMLGRCGRIVCSFLIVLFLVCAFFIPWIEVTQLRVQKLREFFSEAEIANGTFKVKIEIAFAWGILWLVIMRQVFARFARGEILSVANARSISWLGGFYVASLLVDQAVLPATAAPSDRIDALFSEHLLIGVFLLALGWAFKQAVNIKEENDLTV